MVTIISRRFRLWKSGVQKNGVEKQVLMTKQTYMRGTFEYLMLSVNSVALLLILVELYM